MNIQWYPGHMAKAVRMMQENIKLVNAVVYVLDARAIRACINPTFDKIIGNKPILYVVNKIDMVEKADLDKWKIYFETNKLNYIFVNSRNNQFSKKVITKLQDVLKDITKKYLDKGVNKTLRAMVIGIPNSGKSTLINCLCRQKKTQTGDIAGVTRSKQWVKVGNNLELLDTPGTLCPAFENQEIAQNLAFIGSINQQILDLNDLCFNLIKVLMEVAPTKLMERYKLESLGETPLETYEMIAKSRGFLIRGGEYDYDRCAKAVVDDFRKLNIGKIMLEFPNLKED